MKTNEEILMKMIAYDAGDPKRIQHFLKVYQFARLIGLAEGLSAQVQQQLEVAAITHDIGIHASEVRYRDASGKHQEELGPDLAAVLLADCGLPQPTVERICWLIGHHHTYQPVDGPDHQILLEADYLVNALEDGKTGEAAVRVGETFFRTKTGLTLLHRIYR